MSRREQILQTAARLFAARGFHGVSVSEIGAACGISGPALYKHFGSKDLLLAEMLEQISVRLRDEARRRVAAADSPAAAVTALVEHHVAFALEQPALIVVQDRDWASLPTDARERVRGLQREYVATWAEQLRLLAASRASTSPGGEPLSEDEARATAHVVFGLVNSTPHSAVLPADEMRVLLTRSALRVLGL
ncbi:TetR/AcrR family transcriptional regulator [Nocardioides bruguierae]|uniref:TetR/AcrR family transcriptional regulator n=1 Tax=Nocardioides bruguierae TaxID=2945102 RepID=UPI0020223161|nr:TetR/AcrR family transcriptional regulator [Nocardioides bruguierae]MCL8026784.1 TetR/AcrR family transcriptional regulator [Nocardioides bruguierae]